jgi:hypothetical protein
MLRFSIFICLFLAGCQTTQDRMAVDDAKCQSYGTKPGDPAYIQCRMNLDNNRAAVTASERFGNGGGLVGAIQRAADR